MKKIVQLVLFYFSLSILNFSNLYAQRISLIERDVDRFFHSNMHLWWALDILRNSKDERILYQSLESLDCTGILPSFTRPPDRFYKREHRRQLQLRFIAYLLWMEVRNKSQFSILDLKRDEQLKLFSYISTFGKMQGMFIFEMIEDIHLFQNFWPTLNNTSRDQAINAIANWMRNNVKHNKGEDNPQRLESALRGGSWGSCNSSVTFMQVMALSLGLNSEIHQYQASIPSMYLHFFIDFPDQGKFLVHGDDPYSSILKTTPISELFVKNEQRQFFWKEMNHNPSSLNSFSWLHIVEKVTQYPDNNASLAQCEGLESFKNHLYRRLSCSGCPNLADFSKEVDDFLQQNFDKLKPPCL